jgi:hypothetical protein|tara:strand:- start:720 stop:905 length:186 start_codon:yes stop_codon:yes gene_type:complete
MNDLDFLFDETAAPSYEPTAEDWADYAEYLDSIGYDEGDDDWDEDPDAGHGFQNLDTDCPF